MSSLESEFSTIPSTRLAVSVSVRCGRPQSVAHSKATQLWSMLAARGYWQLQIWEREGEKLKLCSGITLL